MKVWLLWGDNGHGEESSLIDIYENESDANAAMRSGYNRYGYLDEYVEEWQVNDGHNQTQTPKNP